MMYKVFQNPFGHYMYDARVNRIVAISEALAGCIRGEKNAAWDEKKKEAVTQEYQKLRQEGFFDESSFEMKNPDKEMMLYLYKRNLSSMTLQVTQSCNFRCSYCPFTENIGSQRKHENVQMSLEMAYRAVDYLHEHSIDSNHINIGFYGGEPLIAFDVIQKVVHKANRLFEGKRLGYSITTNGSLLTDEILTFFEENNVYLIISLDGPKEINDKFRKTVSGKSAFDSALAAIQKIDEKYPELKSRFAINMVMNPQEQFSSYGKLFEEVPLLRKFSVTANFVDLSHTGERAVSSDDFITKTRYNIFLEYLAGEKKIIDPSYRNVIASVANTNKATLDSVLETAPFYQEMFPSGPCMPGYLKCFVDVKGDFFPCEKVSEVNELMKIGSLREGHNVEKCKKLMDIPYLTENNCKNCWVYRFCNSCYIFTDKEESKNKELRLKHCSMVKNNAEDILNCYIAEKRI